MAELLEVRSGLGQQHFPGCSHTSSPVAGKDLGGGPWSRDFWTFHPVCTLGVLADVHWGNFSGSVNTVSSLQLIFVNYAVVRQCTSTLQYLSGYNWKITVFGHQRTLAQGVDLLPTA